MSVGTSAPGSALASSRSAARRPPRARSPRSPCSAPKSASALADFAAEHGERGLRALGGRRAAERLLDSADPGADVPALAATLERAAGLGGQEAV